jgi:hypothetical protein
MAGDKSDQGSKEEIAEGMSEAGSGGPTSGEGPEDKSGGTSR